MKYGGTDADDNNNYTNRLINETSPYLLQHAHNPVNWYPWGDEAFEKARSENKLVFLSIGYSTCHWCHVMEKESFEDAEVAEVLNRSFVAVKVDREQRPDLDSVFMDAAQILGNRGGWPLNLVLTPDLKPFFAATYIPKQKNMYMRGMLDLLPEIHSIWLNEPERVQAAAKQAVETLGSINADKTQGLPGATAEPELNSPGKIKTAAYEALVQNYDEKNGGFGRKPKFPQAQNILFLLRYYNSSGESHALEMAENTLLKMRAGGMFDQLGYGFHRYSTDAAWLLPHFEKMLYDQSMLLIAYSEAWLLTGKDEYRQTADEIIQYVLRDMLSPEGGFYSAEDADSEGVEGKFYLWKYGEFRDLLLKNGYEPEAAAGYYNVKPGGNFTDESTGIASGENILHINGLNITAGSSEIRALLFAERETRVRPARDDKILTDWNGLMIFALARASWIFGSRDYLDHAKTAADFILSKMKTPDGSLLHCFRSSHAETLGMIDDYAFLIRGLLELYRADFSPEYIVEAQAIAACACRNLEDSQNGGFFQADSRRTDLLIRKKNKYDNALPSGNSVMYENLMQLYKVTGAPHWRDSAEGILGSEFTEIKNHPSAFGMMLSSLEYSGETSSEIIIEGTTDEASKMLDSVNRRFLPGSVVIIKTAENTESLAGIAPYTAAYADESAAQTAWICRNFTCNRPVHTAEEFKKLL